MKFWKPVLLTTLLFSAFATVIIATSCEKNPCNNVSCDNGGSCNNGVCRCPTGYENTQCQTKSVTRYLGTYAGYTTCNNSAQVIDSAYIYADTSNASMLNYVWVVYKSISPKVLHGYVRNNESTYTIVVPNVTATNYLKIYTISLESYGNKTNNKLSIQTYEKSNVVPNDTVVTTCSFIGFKN